MNRQLGRTYLRSNIDGELYKEKDHHYIRVRDGKKMPDSHFQIGELEYPKEFCNLTTYK